MSLAWTDVKEIIRRVLRGVVATGSCQKMAESGIVGEQPTSRKERETWGTRWR